MVLFECLAKNAAALRLQRFACSEHVQSWTRVRHFSTSSPTLSSKETRQFHQTHLQSQCQRHHRQHSRSPLLYPLGAMVETSAANMSLPQRSASTKASVLTDGMEKPLLDNRTYRVVRLPNDLEALLIHDPDTDKASAAMDVNIGSFSDADDMPGMAHAVEHLLFMGTEKVC
jgi:hypothetical protein